MNEPAIAAIGSHRVASRSNPEETRVRIAARVRKKERPPTPATHMRSPQLARSALQPRGRRRIENTVKTAKRGLNFSLGRKMSPSRPRLTTSTAITTRKPSQPEQVARGCRGQAGQPGCRDRCQRARDQHDRSVIVRHHIRRASVFESANPFVSSLPATTASKLAYV